MPGERRLTSIKQLVQDMMFNANLTGTITIDEITGTVTVQLLEPVTIDGTINIGTMPSIVIQDIVNLNVDSLPPITGTISSTITNNPLITRNSPMPITTTTTVTSLTAVSVTIAAANANRKYILIRNTSNSDAKIYIRLDATAATTTNAIALRKGESFEFPQDFTYLGAITAISDGYGSDMATVIEGV